MKNIYCEYLNYGSAKTMFAQLKAFFTLELNSLPVAAFQVKAKQQ
jgi:hypothetical protein